jgi:hypothetical protein
MPPLVARIVV